MRHEHREAQCIAECTVVPGNRSQNSHLPSHKPVEKIEKESSSSIDLQEFANQDAYLPVDYKSREIAGNYIKYCALGHCRGRGAAAEYSRAACKVNLQ